MRIRTLSALLCVLLLTGCTANWRQGEVVVIQEDKVTVQILAGQSTSDAGSEDMIHQALQEKFPGVDFQWTCVDWGDAFAAQMTSRFAAGKTPDILIGKAQDVAVYQALGAILPIEDAACVEAGRDTLERVSVAGTVYGIPYNSLYQGVLYNKAIFSELGLSVPRTRQELEQAVAACEQAGITPFAVHYGDTWAVANVTMQFWMNDLFLRYPRWSEAVDLGHADFQSEPLIRDAFEQCRYMRRHSFEDAMQINQTECDKRFAQGEAAMFMTGTWTLQTLNQQTPDLEVGIFPYPSVSGDARLLEETNLTFMKGNTGKNSALVDQVLLELGTNQSLAGEIAEFTTADSTFQNLKNSRKVLVLAESEAYRAEGKMSNVALGNAQFTWPVQMAIAKETIQWLNGELDMDGLLRFAEQMYLSG